jgi:hypothetical protein
MKAVTVLRPFTGVAEGRRFVAGDSFEASDERAAELLAGLPEGYVSVKAAPKPRAARKPAARRKTAPEAE